MSRELDRRDFTVSKVSPDRQEELNSLADEVSNTLPGAHRIRIATFDSTKGNPSTVTSESAPAEAGNYVQRALDHVQNIGRALGLEQTHPPEFAADPDVQIGSTGGTTVHLQQLYLGIPVFEATQAVRFTHDGTLRETVGSSATFPATLSASPNLSVLEAVARAAQYVAIPDDDERDAVDPFGEPLEPVSVDLTGFSPEIIATISDDPKQTTDLAPGPFGDELKASLIWFLLGDEPRLSWEVILTMPECQD